MILSIIFDFCFYLLLKGEKSLDNFNPGYKVNLDALALLTWIG